MRVFTWILFCFYTGIATSQILYVNQESNLLDNSAIYGDDDIGAGISFFDFDNDGWDDITIPSSTTNDFQFFKNNNGTFEQINLNITSGGLEARQAIWVDFDNDGDNDFFATSEDDQRCWLYINNQEDGFEDITEISGIAQETLKYWGASWGDYNNDGFLDVFLSVRDLDQIQPNLLYRNNGDGTFSNVSAQAGISDIGFISFCSAFFDFDNDGDQDIYVANDKDPTHNNLYRNNGDNTFTEVSVETNTNLHMSGMSTTIDDYNNDGWLDIYVTNLYPSFLEDATHGNAFLQNNGDGTFSNIALDNGTRFDSIGWGSVFLDADNDTDKDLYVSGNLQGNTGLLPAAFYENDGDGNYTIPTNIGFQGDTKRSYSNAIGDIKNNGFPDIVVLNIVDEPIFLWENLTQNDNNWIKVQLEGTTSNRMGIGSKIKVFVEDQIYYGYTLCGEGYIAQNSGREFFGLGNATSIDAIEVHWLSGQVDRIENLDVNQTLTIIEGENPLSIDDIENASVTVFPNPAGTSVQINKPDIYNGGTLTIYDMLGKKIMDKAITNGSMHLDIASLDQGIYIIELRNETQKTITRLVHQ